MALPQRRRELRLPLLSASGEALGEMGTAFTGEFTADGQAAAVAKTTTSATEATAFSMPEEATDLKINVWSVEFMDGTEWTSEE